MLRLLYRLGTGLIVAAAVSTVVVVGIHDEKTAVAQGEPTPLPVKPHSYMGVYVPGVPDSTAGLTAFAAETGTRPDLVVYYSGWYEPFRSTFAAAVAARGAVPLVQIDPAGVSMSLIARGWYDKYLAAYAQAVRGYGHAVIISIGHEMNGNWFPWGRGKTSPADFVLAWRHIVKVFRAWGAYNVTWLWTVNSLAGGPGTAVDPRPWWPGADYVTWVGIDGYYFHRAETFTALFGPTMSAVHRITSDPVLITETGVAPAAGMAAKIPGLFAGARSAGVLGVVWFDASGYRDWRIDQDRAALAAFRKATRGFG